MSARAPNARAQSTFKVALGWNLALTTGRVLTTALVAVALAAILGPTAFGTVAIATVYVTMMQLLFQQGFAPVLIRRGDIDDLLLQAAFRALLVGSVVLAVATAALSPLLGRVFDSEQLPELLVALSLVLPLHAVGLVPEAVLRREMEFRALALRTNVAVVVGGATGLCSALAGAGAWALVAQQLVTTCAATCLIYRQVDWRPRRTSLRSWVRTAASLLPEVLRTSLASLSQVAGAQADTVVIGLLIGPTGVGLYRLAMRLVEIVYDLGVRALQSAALSDLARARRTGDSAQRSQIPRLQRLLCLLALPPLGLLVGVAEPLTALLGPEWLPAAPPLRLLAAGGTGLVVIALGVPLLQVDGRPGVLALLQAVSAVLVVAALLVTGAVGTGGSERLEWLAGVRGAVLLVAVLPLHIYVLKRLVALPHRAFLSATTPGWAVAGVVTTTSAYISHLTPAQSAIANLALATTVAGAAGLMVSVVVARRQLLEVVAVLRRAGRTRGGSP